MENTTATNPQTEENSEAEITVKPRLKHEAELYSTWLAWEKGKMVYVLILHKVYVKDQLEHYNVLRLFDSEINEVAPEVFSDMIETGKVKRWKL